MAALHTAAPFKLRRIAFVPARDSDAVPVPQGLDLVVLNEQQARPLNVSQFPPFQLRNWHPAAGPARFARRPLQVLVLSRLVVVVGVVWAPGTHQQVLTRVRPGLDAHPC